MKPLVLCSPWPRTLEMIFTPEARARLEARYTLVETTDADFASLPEATLARARYILGQPSLSPETLAQLSGLRAILNVESNLLDNMPYEQVFARGIHVLTTGAVFAEPVAEIGLGMALALARNIAGADADMRAGREAWGLESNAQARLLSGSDIGIIGFGDLGRALNRLLTGFRAQVRVYDPWVAPSVLRAQGVTPASLTEVLSGSDTVFCLASVTAENAGFLGAEHFAAMRPGAAFILLSRAAVVQFEALAEAVRSGHIRAASDVYPEEPLPLDSPLRALPGFLHSAHRAGALDAAFLRMGEMVLEDMALMDMGLPPMVCKRAERETAARMRSKPVAKS